VLKQHLNIFYGTFLTAKRYQVETHNEDNKKKQNTYFYDKKQGTVHTEVQIYNEICGGGAVTSFRSQPRHRIQ